MILSDAPVCLGRYVDALCGVVSKAFETSNDMTQFKPAVWLSCCWARYQALFKRRGGLFWKKPTHPALDPATPLWTHPTPPPLICLWGVFLVN